MLKKNRIITSFFCSLVLGGSMLWAASGTSPYELFDALQDPSSSVNAYNLTGVLNARRVDEDDEDKDPIGFGPWLIDKIFTMTSSTSNGTITIRYSDDPGQAKTDYDTFFTEFYFGITERGELIFANTANLSGGYSGAGLFFIAEEGKLTFQENVTLSGNTSTFDGGAINLMSSSTLTVLGSTTFDGNKAIAIDAEGDFVGNSGGAVWADESTLVFGDTLTVRDNEAFAHGGAFYLFDVDMTVTGIAVFTENKAGLDEEDGFDEYGGGAIYAIGDETKITFKSEATFGGTTATLGNTSRNHGGAVYAGYDAELMFDETATFRFNTAAAGGGGAMYVINEATVTFGADSYFWDNEATVGDGGGLYIEDATVVFSDTAEFLRNTATNGHGGGAIYIDGAAGILMFNGAATFSGNSATGSDGGALHATYYSTVVFNEFVTISNNNATVRNSGDGGRGGGIFALWVGDGDLEDPEYGIQFTQGGTFSDNTAKDGGAFYLESAAISFVGTAKNSTTIESNTASGNGGAFYLDSGMVSFAGPTTIQGNKATGTNSVGGAFYVTGYDSTLRFEKDSTITIAGNTATKGGGAIYVEDEATLTLDLLANATVNLTAGTGNDIVLNGEATLAVIMAEGSSLNIASKFTGDEDSSLSLTGPGTVTLTGEISYQGDTEIGGGAILTLGGQSTFGDLNSSVFTIGEEGPGILNFSITDDNAKARLSVAELIFGDDGAVWVTLPSDDSGSAGGTFALIEVDNDGHYFDWSEHEHKIRSSLGFLKLTLEYAGKDDEEYDPYDDYDPTTNNLLSAHVEIDEDGDWDFYLVSDFALRKTILGGEGKVLVVNGPGTLYIGNGSKDNIVYGLAGNGHIVLNDNMDLSKTATLTVEIVGESASTFGGTISGGGSLIKDGTGLLELTGTNDYGGGTVVAAGTLKGSTDSLQGIINVLADAQVAFSQTQDGTFIGTLEGSGDIVVDNVPKSDGGIQTDTKLIFNKVQAYAGDTKIEKGWLLLESTGSLTQSDVRVGAVGGLGGAGTVAKDVYVATGGAVQAYQGDLKIQGKLEFSSGSYLYVIANGAETDVVVVSGTATLDGVTVRVVGCGDSFREYEAFEFFTAENKVGDFANSESTYLGYTFVWDRDADGTYWMTGYEIPPTPPVAVGLTWNQTQTKTALDTIYAMGPGTVLYDTIRILNALNPKDPDKDGYHPEYLAALDQLSGASRANSLRLGMFSPAANMFNRLAMGETVYTYGGVPYNNGYGPLDAYGMRGAVPTIRGQDEYYNPHHGLGVCPVPPSEKGFWVDVVHVQSNIDSDGNSAGFGSSRTGFFIGYDAMKTPETKVGVLFGYFAPYLWQNGDRYDADDYHLGLFVQRQRNGAEILGYLGYAHQQYSASRSVSVLGPTEQYTGKTSGNSLFTSLELAQPRWTASGLVIRPLLGLDYLLTSQKGYGEKGDGYYALNYGKTNYEQLFLRAGVHFKKETYRSTGVLRLQYIYEALGRNTPGSETQFAAVSGVPMNIRGVDLGRNYLNVGAGVNLLLNAPRPRRLGLDYNFNLGKRLAEHAIGVVYVENF